MKREKAHKSQNTTHCGTMQGEDNISGHNTVSSNRNQVKNSQQHTLAKEQQQQKFKK